MPIRPGRIALVARRKTLVIVLCALALCGCGLIVGTPVGDHVFPSDGSTADATEPDGPSRGEADANDGTVASDGPSAGDGPSGADASIPDADASAPQDSGVDATEAGCQALHGPTSIPITSPAGNYCIDATEVTNGEYTLFLASGFQFADGGVPAGCEVEGGAMSYTPVGANWPPAPGVQNFPVTNVTWCDAYAYCTWAGKRLCGQIGGGPLAESQATNPLESEWYNACSDGGKLQYPYGNTFDPATCGGQQAGSSLVNVGPPTGCIGGVPGLYNMSGSTWEWVNACATTAPGAFCYTMGGAFDSLATELECTSIRNWTRTSSIATNIGIRCCADP
jgi:sulfatase modifying factor 1